MTIIVKTSFKATHNWPEASQFAGSQVDFLENEHRHTFHVTCHLEVSHEDRDVEFFVLQGIVNKGIQELYPTEPNQLVARLGRRSCETIGKELIDYVRKTLSHKGSIKMEVWEDNEVGAIVEHYPK